MCEKMLRGDCGGGVGDGNFIFVKLLELLVD